MAAREVPRRSANSVHVEPELVADQAANAAKLCLNASIEERPAEAISLAAAGLFFVDKVTRETVRELEEKSVRELMPLADAWVTYVSTGCPQ
ncbi:MAG: hypothetical protein AAF799_21875 [Myxococcota bacterium]